MKFIFSLALGFRGAVRPSGRKRASRGLKMSEWVARAAFDRLTLGKSNSRPGSYGSMARRFAVEIETEDFDLLYIYIFDLRVGEITRRI